MPSEVMHLRLDAAVQRRIRVEAVKRGLTIGEYLVKLIELHKDLLVVSTDPDQRCHKEIHQRLREQGLEAVRE